MSDNFSGQNNNTKLSDSSENADYFRNLNDSDNIDDISLSYDHMYASSNSDENGIVNTTDGNCQTAESEVKFLKEWLVLHLDLIQQQNDEILSKEKTIFILQQENEMLKERINCMERGTSFHSKKFLTIRTSPEIISGSFPEDMTQDLGLTDDNNDKADIGQVTVGGSTKQERSDRTESELSNNIAAHLKLPNSIECNNIGSNLLENNIKYNNVKSSSETIVDFLNSNSSKYKGSYSVHNSFETESMKNLKMSIRRKRLCSNSSAFSNNDSMSEDKRSYRRSRKKRKRIITDDQILTCKEQYVTHTGEINLSIISPAELGITDTPVVPLTNLEVPRWRIKSYTSCYTMEGTENLDDDVYNRRHSRLENDERRRKRWDVQRIREQRVIEKLKQRQDKVGTNSRMDEHSEPVLSLWPTVDDIEWLQVCDNLPVSAFGHPVPKLPPSEFSIPWLNNPNNTLKKVTTMRKPAGRRRRSKR